MFHAKLTGAPLSPFSGALQPVQRRKQRKVHFLRTQRMNRCSRRRQRRGYTAAKTKMACAEAQAMDFADAKDVLRQLYS
jgi:hypothetical protein